MRDLAREVYESVRRNKLRTALAGFSVAWGIFMLIVLLGAGNGLVNGFERQSSGFVSNAIDVSGGYTTRSYDGLKMGRRIKLNDKDLGYTRNFSELVDDISPTVRKGSMTIVAGANTCNTTLEGVYPESADMDKKTIYAGRYINNLDIDQKRKTIVLSSNDADVLFGALPYESVLGRYVSIGGLQFKVVGIYKNDSAMMGSDSYIPFTTLQTIFATGDVIDNIVFTFHGIDDMEHAEAFETEYRAVINTAHRADPEDTGALWLWNRIKQNMQMSKAGSLLQTVLWIIGLFTLLSGIVGISNLMLITVKERTHEFGIRKALGARPSKIMALIIAESVAITSVFGYIGMVLGIYSCQMLVKVVDSFSIMGQKVEMMVDPGIGLGTAVAATAVLVVSGTVAGMLPALKAVKVRPIEALNASK